MDIEEDETRRELGKFRNHCKAIKNATAELLSALKAENCRVDRKQQDH